MYRITTNNDVVTYVCEAHYTGIDESTIKEFELIDNIPGMCNKCEKQLDEMFDDEPKEPNYYLDDLLSNQPIIELESGFYPDQFE